MTLVTFSAVCIDAVDPSVMSDFWARTLKFKAEKLSDGDAVLRGSGPGEEVWINTVTEPKTVWHRVHLDLRAESLEPFADLKQVSGTGEFVWTTFADPEGGEFCVFVHDEPIEHRLKDVVVQALDPTATSQWWADVIGGELTNVDDDYSHLDDVPGSSLESIDFVITTAPKTVKNRIHWDVTLNDGVSVDDIVAAGATILRAPDDEIHWTVMADPEGNEFCVFAAN
ncbi:MAG: VOC family protein [Aeromicrobium sp.]